MSKVGATRYYKPVPATLTEKERMFANEGLDDDYRHGAHLDVPGFDFLAPSSSFRIMTRRVALRGNNRPEDFEPEFFDMGPFQITYNFSRAARNNMFLLRNAMPYRPKAKGNYGAPGWSFRLLYEFLCENYNNGHPFVDTYFGQVFKTRPVYEDFKRIYETVQESINQEQLNIFATLPLKADGSPDMRYAVSKRFKDFKVWQDPIIRQDCKRLAGAIREDVGDCLENGRIPLRSREMAEVAETTKEKRAELIGLNPERLFFASGSLIEHLNIYVEIGKVT
jgi:hypothetical protein